MGRVVKGADGGGKQLPAGAYYVLTILTALNVVNVWHRYLIANLSAVSVEDCEDECDDVSFEPLCYFEEDMEQSEEDCLACRASYNTDFYNLKDGACIDTTQYGILAGVGFTIMFAVATLFAGRLIDTVDRRFLHTSAIIVWSLAASAHGSCNSFNCLLVARIFVGIGEAFNAPACYALITLYFPDARRATANGIYSTGTYLGSAVSSLCLTLAAIIGWRITAFFSGACGVVCAAFLFFTVDHHPRQLPPASIAEEYSEIPSAEKIDGPSETSEMLKMPASDMVHTGKANGVTYSSLAAVSARSRTHGDEAGLGGAGGEWAGGAGDSDVAGGGFPQRRKRAPLEGKELRRNASSSSFSSSTTSGDVGGNPFAHHHNHAVTTTPVVVTTTLPASYQHDPYLHQETDCERPLLAVTPSFDEASEVAPHFASDGEDVRSCSWCPSAARKRGTIVKVQGKPRGYLEVDRRRGSSCGGDFTGSSYGWFDRAGGGESSDDSDGGRYLMGGAVDSGHLRPMKKAQKHDLAQSLRTIMNNRIVLVLFAASSARMIATWTMAGYMATYYKRAFPSQTSLYSVLNAIFVSTGGMASSYLGGVISDRLRVRDEGVLGYLPALGSAAAIIPMTIVLFSPSFGVSITALFVTYLMGECWLGPGMALLQMEMPTELAGTSVAILLFLNSVLSNVGPIFVAWKDPGTDAVRKPFYAMALLSFVSSFVLFAICGFMVSQKGRRRKQVLSAIDDAGIYDNSGIDRSGNISTPSMVGGFRHQNSGGKSVNFYARRGHRPPTVGAAADANGQVGNHNGNGTMMPSGQRDYVNGRQKGSSVSVCEVVRRTFSGTGLTSTDGEDGSGYSDDAGVIGHPARGNVVGGIGQNGVRDRFTKDDYFQTSGSGYKKSDEREAIQPKTGWSNGVGSSSVVGV